MVSTKLLIALLVIAILVSAVSIIMTLSININYDMYYGDMVSGNPQAKVILEIVPNPPLGEQGGGG